MANPRTAETNATGHFNAILGANDVFESERVHIGRVSNLVVIEGFKNLGHPDGKSFGLTIDPATPGGPQQFSPRGYLYEVFYLNGGETVYAQSGTYEANLNHSTKQYRITFKLIFARYGEIHGDVDVSE